MLLYIYIVICLDLLKPGIEAPRLFYYLYFMKKAIIAVLTVFLVLAGCRTTKQSITTSAITETLSDSTEQRIQELQTRIKELTEQKIIVDRIETLVRVPIECDSAGNVKPLKATNKSGPVFNSVSVENNELVIDTKVDSIISYYRTVYDSIYESKFESFKRNYAQERESLQTDESKIVKTRFPWWLYAIIGVGVVFIAWRLFVPKT